ncbi:MAG: hypothetical protein JXJ30_01535 [Halothiobacillaceae bacterium]|nr:hypothetical protein [Halothiobacillaceae bacterium]
MTQQSLDLRDEFDYQPELIARLVDVYEIALRFRWLYASAIALAGAVFMMQWSLLANTAVYGQPWVGVPLIALAVWLGLAPAATIAKWVSLPAHFSTDYLSFRDLHWIRLMTERHPVLTPSAEPFLKSPEPVPVGALRHFWAPLVREEERQQR